MISVTNTGATQLQDPKQFPYHFNNSTDARLTAQFLVLAAKARALVKNRYHVTYEDIRALYIPILRHRILLNFHAESDRLKQDDLLKRLLETKPAP